MKGKPGLDHTREVIKGQWITIRDLMHFGLGSSPKVLGLHLRIDSTVSHAQNSKIGNASRSALGVFPKGQKKARQRREGGKKGFHDKHILSISIVRYKSTWIERNIWGTATHLGLEGRLYMEDGREENGKIGKNKLTECQSTRETLHSNVLKVNLFFIKSCA